MKDVLYFIQWFVFAYLLIQVAYLLFFAVAGHLVKQRVFEIATKLRTIRVFIPGYKEDSVIIETAASALQHDYPKDKFEVVIIADSFSPATLDALHKLGVKVVEVSFEKSTKGKALHKAIEATSANPMDIVVVLDADNHMAPGFLHSVNNAFEAGYEVVQGHRTAKNLQTAFACLDACTEEINNHIFRRGHTAAGLPSALIGSGMAFRYDLFTGLLENIGDTSGEDKELEFRIVRLRKNVAFLNGSYVFDEKVARKDVFSKQRSRWLATQVEFFQKYFIEGWLQLAKGNIAFFNKVFQTYLLPRVMLVAVLTLWTLASLLFMPLFAMPSIVLLVALATALFISIPTRWMNRHLAAAFLQIPAALFSMLRAMMQIGKARRQFIHTPHGELETKTT